MKFGKKIREIHSILIWIFDRNDHTISFKNSFSPISKIFKIVVSWFWNSKSLCEENEFPLADFITSEQGGKVFYNLSALLPERNRCGNLLTSQGRMHSSKVWKGWLMSSLLFHSAAKFYFHFIFLSRFFYRHATLPIL